MCSDHVPTLFIMSKLLPLTTHTTFFECPSSCICQISVPTLSQHEFEMTGEESLKICWVDMFERLPDTLSNLLWVKEFIMNCFDVCWMDMKSAATWWFMNIEREIWILKNVKWIQMTVQTVQWKWYWRALKISLYISLLLYFSYSRFSNIFYHVSI